MARKLKQSTAAVVVVGPFVDSAGAAVTAPTIASIDITAYKNDGTAVTIAPAASGSSNDMVHVDDGFYSLELTATDTNTCGYLRLTFQISGSLIFMEDFEILSGAAYDRDVNGYEYTLEGGRIWFVDGTTDGVGDTGTRAAPFDSIGAAVTAAIPGDVIVIRPATYSEKVTVSKNNLTFVGTSQSGVIITHNSTATFLINSGVSDTVVRKMTITSTDTENGAAISAQGTIDTTCEHMTLNGKFDALQITSSKGFIGRRLIMFGTYDCLNANDADRFYFDQCHFETDCTHSTTTDDFNAIIVGSASSDPVNNTTMGVIKNSFIYASRAGNSARDTIGIAGSGRVTLFDTRVVAWALHESGTGDAVCVKERSGAAGTQIETVRCQFSPYQLSTSGAARVTEMLSAVSRCKHANANIIDAIGGEPVTIAADIGNVDYVIEPSEDIAAAVRTNLATELARVDAAISSRNATTPLDAAGTRAALGLNAANLDTQIAAVKSDSAAILVDTAYMQPRVPPSGTLATTADVTSTPDARDLDHVDHVWNLKRSGDGTYRSTNKLIVHPGDTWRAGWNCDIRAILPQGKIIASQGDPELVTASDDLTLADPAIGHDATTAKVEFEVAADAVTGETHWIKTEVTPQNATGPKTVYGEVYVQAEPE